MSTKLEEKKEKSGKNYTHTSLRAAAELEKIIKWPL